MVAHPIAEVKATMQTFDKRQSEMYNVLINQKWKNVRMQRNGEEDEEELRFLDDFPIKNYPDLCELENKITNEKSKQILVIL